MIAHNSANRNVQRRKGNVRRKSIILYTALAILVAALSSRVNQVPAIAPLQRPAILEEKIADAELDLRTFRTAVNSLAKYTRANLIIDSGLTPSLAAEEAGIDSIDKRPENIDRIHNSTLGAAVAHLLAAWREKLPLECHIEGDRITFFASGVSPVSVPRLYDLRAFKHDWATWHGLKESWKPPSVAHPDTGGLFGGNFPARRQNPDVQSAEELIDCFKRSLLAQRSEEFQTIVNWPGCVIVNAPPELHQQFRHFLAAWAESASSAQGVIR
jgi:hypothetical protein